MVGTCLLNRYELTGEFGRGGMGVVYRARDRVLNREVAVKVLYVSDLTEACEERFAREAQLVAQLDHPGVVPIYDFGRHEDALFFVMPVVAGTTLAQRIRDRTLERWEAIEIVAQVAEALEHSHARGVIHRDVKPQNIMVSDEEDGPRARILDFGLALGSAANRLTQSGILHGTLLYLSPEQVISETADARSDLYSLGTVLYECLSGQPPFQGSRFSLLYRIVHEQPPPLAGQGIDRELEAVVLACLAKAPEARPQRGRDLALSLRRYLERLEGVDRGKKIPRSMNAEGTPPAKPLRESVWHPGRWKKNPSSPRLASEISAAQPPPLIGRDHEIAELQQRLRAALDGESQFTLIGGEIGMGKTRLLEELGRFAQLRGIRVLRSRFSDEAAFPYQGFCELIQDYFRREEPARPANASSGIELGDLAPDLLALYPVLSEIPAIREAARGRSRSEPAFERGDRRQLFELLARTLARLAGGKPVVFLFERLHAAEASIDVFHYIVHRLGPTPTLIVGTYRPTATPKEHPLRQLMLRFQGNPRFCSLRLEALSRIRHRELVTSLLGRQRPGAEQSEVTSELAHRLYEATEGNPLFTRELVHSLRHSGGILPDESGTWSLSDHSALASDALPETIQRIVETRLEQLGEALLGTLTFASVLGRGFEFADLAALVADPEAGFAPADRSESKVDEAVDRLIQEGLLEEDRQARSDRLHFPSRVVREVVYGRLSRRKRRKLHRSHAAQLERRYAGRTESIYPQLLHHYAAGDVPEKTVEYGLKLARKSLASYSAEDTIRAAKIGLEYVGSEELLDRGELEGELRYLLAAASRLAGGIAGALSEIALAVRSFERAEDWGQAAAAALMAAETAWQGRRVDDTRHWVETGIRLARHAGAGETLRQLLTLGATVSNMQGEYGRGKVFLAQAAELARHAPAPAEDPAAGGTVVTAVPHADAILDREAFSPHPLETPGDPENLANQIGSPSGRGERQSGAVLVPLTTAFDKLDPELGFLADPTEVIPNVFESLTRVDEGARLVPCLAAEFRAVDGDRRFRFRLRDDVRFHDGRRLTARDVRYSFERVLRSRRPGAKTALLPIRGARALWEDRASELEGLTIVSALEVVIELERPMPIFPGRLAHPTTGILPEGSENRAGSWLEGCVGTGPFRVVSFEPGKWVELEANPNYWRSGYPRCDRLIFELGVAPERVASEFRSGRFSLASHLRLADLEALRHHARFAAGYCESPGLSTYYLMFNAHRGRLCDPEIRRTLARALDVETPVRSIGRLGLPAHGLIPPGLLGYEAKRRPSVSPSSSRDLEGLELTALVHPVFQGLYRRFWEKLCRSFEELGVRLRVRYQTAGNLCTATITEDVDVVATRWLADFPDSDTFVSLFDSRMGPDGGLFGNEEIDRLIEQGRSEPDPALRNAIYRELEEILAHDAFVVPLFHEQIYRFARPEVQGLRLRFRCPEVAYEELSLTS